MEFRFSLKNDRENGNPIVVKMGFIYLDDNGQIIDVSYITSHPLHKGNDEYNDIALIKLKSAI
jgi:hypothetical protein